MIDLSDPAIGLSTAVVSLGLLILALRQFVADYAQRGVVARRARVQTSELGAGWFHERLDARVRTTEFGGWIDLRLRAAGMEIKTLDFLVLCGFVSLVALIVANVFLPWVLALVVAGVCMRGFWAWVEYQREKRRERFIAQLPEVARLLSNASSAGLAVRRSIEMAAAELDEPAATEMSLIAEELRLGQNVEQALRHLEERMPSREVGVLISTLVIQQRAGGDLVHALQELATALDARRDLIREVRTVMSGSVFTSYMVAGIGIFMLFLINSMSPGAFDKMLGSPWGIAALILSGALYALGFMLIRRTTRIEV